MARVGFDPANTSDVSALYTLGLVLEYGGNWYRYLLNSDGATAAGDAMRWTATVTTANGGTMPTVNNRLIASGGTPVSVTNTVCAGIAVGVVAANSYGWFLKTGYYAACKCDGAVTAGTGLGLGTGANSYLYNLTAAANVSCGMAVTSASSNLCAAIISV